MSQTSELKPFAAQEKLVLGGFAATAAASLLSVIGHLFVLAGVLNWEVIPYVFSSLMLIGFVLLAIAAGREEGRRARNLKRILWTTVSVLAPLLIVSLFI